MDLEQLISDYTPTSEALQVIRSLKLVFLTGISGAGKDTVKRQLLRRSDYHEIVSCTTREPRMNNGEMEQDGREYFFISEDQARDLIHDQAFIEVKFVHGIVYGTPKREFDMIAGTNKIALTDIDVQGLEEYKAISSNVVAIFILPPNYATWRERLSRRYETSDAFEAEWPKRRESAIKELTRALEVPYYHFIINQELDETVRISDEIAHKPDIFHRKDDEARLAARDLLDEITVQI